jgi:S-adenosylmethionine:diacylglycerol 3-amino-3-carboxypropyl transferase
MKTSAMDVTIINQLLEQLAGHYGIHRDYLLWLLLARQTLTIHALTDYTKPATSEELDRLLKGQDTQLAEVIEDSRKQLGEIGRLVLAARQSLQDSNALVAVARKELS